MRKQAVCQTCKIRTVESKQSTSVSVTEQRQMKIDPTKMIDTEIQWLLNFECGTNLGILTFA